MGSRIPASPFRNFVSTSTPTPTPTPTLGQAPIIDRSEAEDVFVPNAVITTEPIDVEDVERDEDEIPAAPGVSGEHDGIPTATAIPLATRASDDAPAPSPPPNQSTQGPGLNDMLSHSTIVPLGPVQVPAPGINPFQPAGSLQHNPQQQEHLALEYAVREGRLDSVEAILNNLETIDRQELLNNTILRKPSLFVQAIQAKNVAALKLLHQWGADVNQARGDEPGWTPLHYAANRGDEATVRYLLTNGAEASINTPAGYQLTPLHKAAERKDAAAVGTVTALLRAGANPRNTDEFGNTPLHSVNFIGQRASTHMVQAMLEAIADPSERVAWINQTNQFGQTALDLALKSLITAECAELTCFLLDQGASGTQPFENGQRPLQRVNNLILDNLESDNRQNLIRIARKLIDKGADPADLAEGPFKSPFKDEVLANRQAAQ